MSCRACTPVSYCATCTALAARAGVSFLVNSPAFRIVQPTASTVTPVPRARPGACRDVPRPCPSEDEEQRDLFEWRDKVALSHEPLLDLLHHCPNGKRRTKAAAGQLKAMGIKRNIPDLFLPVPRHGFHGLWIELKALDGTVPPAQKALHARLREQGYLVAVAFGWLAAAQELCRYLNRDDLARQLGEAV